MGQIIKIEKNSWDFSSFINLHYTNYQARQGKHSLALWLYKMIYIPMEESEGLFIYSLWAWEWSAALFNFLSALLLIQIVGV
jgi:hypothetical protein